MEKNRSKSNAQFVARYFPRINKLFEHQFVLYLYLPLLLLDYCTDMVNNVSLNC